MYCLGSCVRLTPPRVSCCRLMPLSVAEYDRLENAIVKGARVSLMRRGREFLVIPERLQLDRGREIIHTRHPTTGHHMVLFVDELDRVEELR